MRVRVCYVRAMILTENSKELNAGTSMYRS